MVHDNGLLISKTRANLERTCDFHVSHVKYTDSTGMEEVSTSHDVPTLHTPPPLPDDSDADIRPALSAITRDNPDVKRFSEVVPGKGPPPEPPVDCCMSGCANCVWIQYAEELRDYYRDGNERALREINKMDNESLKAFIKLELGLR